MQRRNTFRRTAVAAAAMLTALGLLAGCSAPDSSTSAGATAGGGDGTRIAFVSQVEGIPYFSGFKSGAEKAAKELGVSYTQAGPAKADSAEQKRIVDGLVAQGYDGIAISPLDPTSMDGSIAAASSAGLSVITSDADAPNSKRTVFVSQASDEELGQTAMDQIAEQAGGKGQYAIVSGAADVATFNSWSQAAVDHQLSDYPDMELVGGIRHTADSAEALREAQDLLTAYPDLAGIIAVPSTAVPGVAQAVQNAGKAGKVAVTGFGSPKTVAPFIKSGVMKSSVLWNVDDLGYLTVWALVQVLDGKEFAAENDVPGLDEPVRYDDATKTLLLGTPTVFTEENVDDFDF
ncbi:autoinducer 2 ABC transporter substrate-binding protein [Microbacterium sp. NPDC058389]|uniref:autoinducer 2 ABC transporter substrate-binding protein n=1 Tax=Microbacterium sp. NPDC058389 TaxID=3346475 RepID=UPI0036666660